jgi:hypothetical protein
MRLKPTAEIPNPDNPCSLAILDGDLCRVNRKGRVVIRHEPIGTAVTQFCVLGSGNIVVLERPFGLLGGISNAMCLDDQLRLLFFFESPPDANLYQELLGHDDETVTLRSTQGEDCVLAIADGRLISQRGAATLPVG